MDTLHFLILSTLILICHGNKNGKRIPPFYVRERERERVSLCVCMCVCERTYRVEWGSATKYSFIISPCRFMSALSLGAEIQSHIHFWRCVYTLHAPYSITIAIFPQLFYFKRQSAVGCGVPGFENQDCWEVGIL